MHPNPVFRKTKTDHSIRFLRDRSFGTLVTNGDPVPMMAHIPFELSADCSFADLHFVRSNPLVPALKTRALPAVLSVTGPDSYVSPDWYGVPDQVPTWNYVAVTLSGRLELLPDTELRTVLDRLSHHFEQRLLPKTPWTSGKMSEGVMDRMMRAIVPARLHIDSLESTWKLGQNKPDNVRKAAAAQIAIDGIGSEIGQLGALMDSPPKDA